MYDNNHIGLLTVNGAAADTPALRLAVSTQVAALDIKSEAMPPSAILIVKQLADPAPGSIGTDNQVFNPNRQWESAINARLDEAYYSALTPQHGILPSDAETVLFADQAQMLACLLTDRVTGHIGEHWWWEQLVSSEIRVGDLSSQITRICCEHIRSLPAALDQLQVWRNAELVLSQIDAADALGIALELCRMHGLQEWHGILVTATCAETTAAIIPRQAEKNKSSQVDSSLVTRSPNPAAFNLENSEASPNLTWVNPWQRWLGDSGFQNRLAPLQALTMGLGIMLHRMPWVLRQGGFTQAVSKWLEQPTRIGDGWDKPTTALNPAIDQASAFAVDKTEQNRNSSPQPSVALSDGAEYDPVTGTLEDASNDKLASNSETIAVQSRFDSAVNEYQAGSKKGHTRQSLRHVAEDSIHDPQAVETDDTRDSLNYNGVTLVTDLGGIFYLINLIEQLEIPACFERDWGLASRLSRWALLDSLARYLLASDFEAYADDPIWELLAELDNRSPGDLIGNGLRAANCYFLPKSWHGVLSGENQACYWAAAQGVLRLWSTNAYMLVEVPRDNQSAKQQASSLLHEYVGNQDSYILSRSASNKAPLDEIGFACNANLKHWLALGMPAARQYLQILLTDGHSPHASRIKKLLRCSGQLYVSATHIDFISVLDRISMDARACGLDRDPGWIPEYSRTVKFYFN